MYFERGKFYLVAHILRFVHLLGFSMSKGHTFIAQK
jgi:hypothetical protein